MTEISIDRKKDVDAITGMLARIQESVSTMVYSDVRTLLRLAYAYGYDTAKRERLEDIKLFEGAK